MSTLRVAHTGGEFTVSSASSAIPTLRQSPLNLASRNGGGQTKQRAAKAARWESPIRQNLLRDEARLLHQARVDLVVFLQEFHHIGPCEEDRLQRLLLHVVLVFGGLRDLLEQVDIERGLVGRDLAWQEHGAQHQVLHVEAFLL